METLLQDLRFAIRTLAKRPGFTAVAVITLMLGIGANTAIFSIVSAVLLRPLPFPDADRLTVLWRAQGGQSQLLIALPDVLDWKMRSHAFEDIGAIRTQSVNLTGTEKPDRLIGSFITANALTILGARPYMGRLFTPEETTVGSGQQVAVVSNSAWKVRFGSDTTLLGRTLILNGRPHVVIGIVAADFSDPWGSDVYIPISSAPNPAWFNRGNTTVWGVGKMKPGFTVERAQQDLAAVAAQLASEYPTTNAGVGATVVSLRDNLVGSVRPTLLILLAFVGVVLLIACANVANLQLARAASRTREMSLRAALGAARGRLVRQLLTESLLLSVLGGVAGVIVSLWAIKWLVANAPGGLPTASVTLDPVVLAFTAGLTIFAGLLFGAAPALHAARTDLADALQVRTGESAKGGTLRNVFVALELALCITLLVGAGLLTRSLAALQNVNPGFKADHVITAEFRLPGVKYSSPEMINDFMARALAALRAVPGFTDAALVGAVPLSGNWGAIQYATESQGDVTMKDARSTIQNSITGGFFRTMGIPMIAGRDFNESDRRGAEMVAIVNQELANKAWPGTSALGQRLRLLGPPDTWVTVVGVVGGIKQLTLGEQAAAQLYQPQPQAGGIFASVVARTAGDPDAMGNRLREAIWTVDRDQPVWKIRSLDFLVNRDLSPQKFSMLLTGAFALLALVLAGVGVYGVMSYAVAQRTREVGIRMALGARQAMVVKMMLARGFRVVGIATLIGVAASFGTSQLLRKQLFGVTATDPVTFVAVPFVLAAVALLACYLPARRAARVDPVIALRSE